MGGFRDDRQALRARIEALEAELRSGGPDREEVLERLRELTAQVGEARRRIESDREGLGDLADRIDALRRDLKGEGQGPWPDVEEEGQAEAASDRDAARMRQRLGIGCVTLLVIGSCGMWLLSRQPKRDVHVHRDPSVLVSASQLPGGPRSVDPMAALEEVHRYAPAEASLVSMDLSYVSSDGTVDLDNPAYDGRIEYRLEAPRADRPRDPSAPLGAPQPTSTARSSTHRVDSAGLHRDSMGGVGGLIPLPGGHAVGDPSCSPAQVWAAAIGAGVPRDAVAQMTYGSSLTVAGRRPVELPIWRFSVEGTDISLEIDDADCRVIQAPGLAADQPDAGSAPSDASVAASR